VIEIGGGKVRVWLVAQTPDGSWARVEPHPTHAVSTIAARRLLNRRRSGASYTLVEFADDRPHRKACGPERRECRGDPVCGRWRDRVRQGVRAGPRRHRVEAGGQLLQVRQRPHLAEHNVFRPPWSAALWPPMSQNLLPLTPHR